MVPSQHGSSVLTQIWCCTITAFYISYPFMWKALWSADCLEFLCKSIYVNCLHEDQDIFIFSRRTRDSYWCYSFLRLGNWVKPYFKYFMLCLFFFQFLQNQGFLVSVSNENEIQVWSYAGYPTHDWWNFWSFLSVHFIPFLQGYPK